MYIKVFSISLLFYLLQVQVLYDSDLLPITLPSCIFQEQELEKQKLLFHQARLANRGVAEMVLLHISAAKGIQTEGVMKTLILGISILRGGNVDVQTVRQRNCLQNGVTIN